MALAKSWEMRPAPAIPHRVGSSADIFEIFVQVLQNEKLNKIQIQPQLFVDFKNDLETQVDVGTVKQKGSRFFAFLFRKT